MRRASEKVGTVCVNQVDTFDVFAKSVSCGTSNESPPCRVVSTTDLASVCDLLST